MMCWSLSAKRRIARPASAFFMKGFYENSLQAPSVRIKQKVLLSDLYLLV